MNKQRVFTPVLTMIVSVFIFSCSNPKDKELQTIFPLGISYEEILNDEQIASRKAQSAFVTESSIKEELTEFYQLDEDSTGVVCHEDNIGTIENLENVTALVVSNYITKGIQYDQVVLLLKDNKLVQVLAAIESKENASLINVLIGHLNNEFGEPIIKEFSKTYFWNGVSDDLFYDVLQFKSENVFFEMNFEDEDEYEEVYYTYYTTKVLPLFGIY